MIDKMEISNQASATRTLLGEDLVSPIDIFSLVQTIDRLTLVLYPLGSKISGACLKSKNSEVIAINSEMSIGRQRFSLAHELYHHYYDTTGESLVCANQIGMGTDIEKSADLFASYLLMPQNALYTCIRKVLVGDKVKVSLSDVIRLEQHFGVSRQAMLYRLRQENVLPANTSDMERNVILNAGRLGYDTALYKPLPKDKQMTTRGYYIKQAESLLEKDLISNGKYEELLLEANRDDIVYGDELEGGELLD